MGLKVQMMFSENGDRIYLIVKADAETIRNEAESIGMNV